IEKKSFKQRSTVTVNGWTPAETRNTVVNVATSAPEPDSIDAMLQPPLRINFHIGCWKSKRAPELLAVNDLTTHHIAITEKSRRLSDIAFAKQAPYTSRRDEIIAFICNGIDKRHRKSGSFSRLLKELRCPAPSFAEMKVIPSDDTARVQSFNQNMLDEIFRRAGRKLNSEGLFDDSIEPHQAQNF